MWLTPQVMLQLLAQRAAEISICLAASPILLGAELLHLAARRYCSALVVAGEVPTAPAQAGGRPRSRAWRHFDAPGVHNLAAASPSPVLGPLLVRNLLDRLTTLWVRMEEPT